MTFIIGIFQFHCKGEHRQVVWNKIKWDMCKSESIFLYLQSTSLFKWLLSFISWQGLSKKGMIMVSEEKCPSFNFTPQILNLQEIEHF